MVPGNGPQPAAGMIVGEAPGRREVELGLPFVGKSGQALDSVLRALGVTRDEVYVTNVVKELPETTEGKIRKPNVSEVAAWLPILQSEIEQTAPVAILALGRTAVEALTDIEGEKVPFGSVVGNIYTAWHPAGPPMRGGQMEEWMEQIRPWAEALGRFEYPS